MQPENRTPLLFKAIGTLTIVFGLFVSATGMYWQKAVTTYLTGPQWSTELELWLPFWPLEPFLALFITHNAR